MWSADDPREIVSVTNDQSNVRLLCRRRPGARAIWISCFLITDQGGASDNPAPERVGLGARVGLGWGGSGGRAPTFPISTENRDERRSDQTPPSDAPRVKYEYRNEPAPPPPLPPSPLTGLIWARRPLMHDGWGRSGISVARSRTPPLAGDHRRVRRPNLWFLSWKTSAASR